MTSRLSGQVTSVGDAGPRQGETDRAEPGRFVIDQQDREMWIG